jgi:PPOX class probable F420-dependent enzyme
MLLNVRDESSMAERASHKHGGPAQMSATSHSADGAAMLSSRQQRFLEAQRVARLATADARGAPHVVPVCFAFADGTLYVTIDEKPKRRNGPPLKRLRNIAENPAVAVVADRYDEEWTRLGWVMLQGRAEILSGGSEHARAQALLCARYPQLEAMDIAALPVIAVRVERVVSWGDLSVAGLASPAQPGLNQD